METIIILGSNGFLGCYLCRFFLDKGFKVIGVGDKSDKIGTEMQNMLLGRNSNFTLKSGIESIDMKKGIPIHISFDKLPDQLSKAEYVIDLLEKTEQTKKPIFIYLPLLLPEEMSEQILVWREKLSQFESVKWLYIGETYGPWNSSFSVEQLEQQSEILAEIIYIEDLLINLDDILGMDDSTIVAISAAVRKESGTMENKVFKEEAVFYEVPVNTTVEEGVKECIKYRQLQDFLDSL